MLESQFVGQIMAFAGNFTPEGWMFCHGQILPISQYTLLFSIIGNMYGGDGDSTFALPDLRNRTPIGFGMGHSRGFVEKFPAPATGTKVLMAGTTNYLICVRGHSPAHN